MSTRLASGGRLIDRSKALEFSFNGKRLRGYSGDTLASALLAEDQMLLGRSFKYHRPRGLVASGAEEPNALVNLGTGARLEPNQRSTTTELFDGLTAASQNHWPSLEFDIGAINTHLSRFLPAGFYYKMFLYPRAFWKHVYEPFIRMSAGLGKAPTQGDADRYEHFNATVDVLVIGGGMANTFLAALGKPVGKSLCEHDLADTARDILARASEAGCEILLPTDVVVASEFKAGAAARTISASEVSDDDMILDIGTATLGDIAQRLETASTVVWNGPLGAFEIPPFDNGTNVAARHVAMLTKAGRVISVAGGGDTMAALIAAGVEKDFTYISAAGGAFLEWLEGKDLPGVKALES